MPSGVCNRLVALQFGGTSEIAQGTTRIVAGGQIQPVSLKHFLFLFEVSYYSFDKKKA